MDFFKKRRRFDSYYIHVFMKNKAAKVKLATEKCNITSSR